MRYAQIKDNIVKNIIVVDENSPLDLLAEGFDIFLRIDNFGQVVGVNYSYDGQIFTAPIEGIDYLNP